MPKCVTEDFTLTVPSDWADRSMITWVAPHSAARKVAPNVLCSQDMMKADEDLDGFVNRQLKELMTKVQDFDLVSRQSVAFGGRPAVLLDFRMKPQGVMLQQRQVFFQSPANPRVVRTVVVTAARSDFPALEKTFESILQSVSWNS
ncbi:MAG: DUF1795 domain-containing protein [Tabrizicola sp.]|jgi:hypothetical protein|nr:DUF1795 domain-containing protein [Tabrizicola sp.]